jgi:hypothetical protein
MKKLILAISLLCCTGLFASTTDSLSVRTNTSETLFNNLAKPDSQTNAVVNVHLKPIMQKAIEAQKAGNTNGKAFDADKEIPGLLSNSKAFNQKLKLLYISVGEQDPRFEFTKTSVAKFRESGLKVEFASFPGDHEWQVWRKSLHDFAQRVFK